jgi:alpha-glucuronidase
MTSRPPLPHASRLLALMLLLLGHICQASADDEGYECWLRYRPIADGALLHDYQQRITGLHAPGEQVVLAAAREELQRGLSGLLDRPLADLVQPTAGALVVGTPGSNPVIAALGLELADLGGEGFLIRSLTHDGQPLTVIAANSDIGVLYGSFRFLRQLQMQQPIADVDIRDVPRLRYRVLNHWDSINGVVSRGYAGQSLWQWDELPDTLSPRYADYGRYCASVGINMTVLNGSYSGLDLLKTKYLKKIAALANALRPYGVHVALHPNFAAPLEFGATDSANPFQPDVQQWWQNKVAEIYGLIPDFGGFMVKADSEGCPGPHDYNATHADGANLLADAVKPYGGIVMWRAFGVFDSKVEGYPGEATPGLGLACRPCDLFPRIDGTFHDNVFLQVKNGPRDFQPREPVHPLFTSIRKTPLMMEVQITQEYFGHAIHLVYLAPVWKEALEWDTHVAGPGSTVTRVMDGSLYDHGEMSGIAGVANTGMDENWTGHLFGQANWYAFGRLAWDPGLSSEAVAEEWIRQTFNNDPAVIETISHMMMGSREAAVDYMTPLGLFQLNDNLTTEGQRSHYAPDPAGRKLHHNADADGIGGSWLMKGMIGLYPEAVAQQFGDPATCPEKYLLWFHHVSWDRELSSGRTVWEELCHRYVRGVEYVKDMRRQWDALKPVIDKDRWKDVRNKLRSHVIDAGVWRDECLIYFSAVSGRAIAPEILSGILND